jgi:hypothetical protein
MLLIAAVVACTEGRAAPSPEPLQHTIFSAAPTPTPNAECVLWGELRSALGAFATVPEQASVEDVAALYHQVESSWLELQPSVLPGERRDRIKDSMAGLQEAMLQLQQLGYGDFRLGAVQAAATVAAVSAAAAFEQSPCSAGSGP